MPLILFPSLLLTGVFFPFEAIPRGTPSVLPRRSADTLGGRAAPRHASPWEVVEVSVDIVALLAYDAFTLLDAAFFVRRQA